MLYFKKIVFFFLITTISFSWSQEKKVFASPEALKSEIVKQRYNNPDKAFELAQSYLQYGLDNNNEKVQCEAYHQLGKIKSIKGAHLSAIHFYDQGIVIAKKIKYYEYLIDLIVVKGNSYYFLNKNIDALNTYLKALELTDASNYNNYQWIIIMNLALLKQRGGDFEKATNLFKNSLDLAYKYPNLNKTVQVNTVSNIIINLGEVYLKRKLLDSSLYYNQLGLKKSLLHNDLQTSSDFLKLIGKAYHEKGDYNKAIIQFKKAAEKAKTLGNSISENEINLLLGLTYSKMKHFDKSLGLLEECIEQYTNKKENISIVTYQEACIAIANIYNEKGAIGQAKIFYEKYIAINDSLQEQETAFITEYYKNDIKKLKNKINTYQTKTLNQRFHLGLGVLIIVLLIVIIYTYRTSLKVILLDKKKQLNTRKNEIVVINSKKVTTIIDELTKLERREFYLHKNCNLYTTAKKLNTNTSYLSKIINEIKKQSFNTYLNNLRIEYAIRKIDEDQMFRSYSVKSIAEELGYKSANSFSKYFKQKTGKLPSTYIKQVKHSKTITANL